MRVLVCGSRFYKNEGLVFETLDSVGITYLIAGCADGADALAIKWAKSRGVPGKKFIADWKTYGKPAGPMRNTRMLVHGKPDLVVAFPGGIGTANMTGQAEAAGIPIQKIEEFPATGSGAPAGLMAAQEK